MTTHKIRTSKDSYIKDLGEWTDDNFGDSGMLWIESTESHHQYVSLIGFSIGSAAANPKSVRLYIYRSDTGNVSRTALNIKRITGEWEEYTVTWDNRPEHTDTNGLIDIYSPRITEWADYDITQLYNDAKSVGDELGIWVEAYRTGEITTPKTFLSSKDSGTGEYGAYIIVESVDANPPTITDITWSPAGEFIALHGGTLLPGQDGTSLRLLGTDPNEFDDPPFSGGEAYLEISKDGERTSAFTVAEYDHFRFDDKEWWALNIVCGPECDLITIADETAEVLRTPKLYDEIQFACNIDWHGVDPDRVEWYYGKPPNKCFTKEEEPGIWELFAEEQMPAHTFTDEDDRNIVFLKVIAKNVNGDIGEYGGTCYPIFNLWIPKFDWKEFLLLALRMSNFSITQSLEAQYSSVDHVEGITTPPYTCPVCQEVFDDSGEFVTHLYAHINAYVTGWFE